MYTLASKLSGLPVMSLQTGETVAIISAPIIDPSHLTLIAYRCEGPDHGQILVLMVRDIRQMALDCVIVDSEEELAEASDIIRVKTLIDQNFTPMNKPVATELGRRLGKVEDYTLNLEANHVQKLYVKPPIWRAWLSSNLVIDRTQIIDVTSHQITVRDATIKATLMQHEPMPESNT